MYDAVPLVIDHGSATCKIGIACDDSPRAVLPSLVGHPCQRMTPLFNKVCVGNEAWKFKHFLSRTWPIEHGLITRWDEMVETWEHAFFNELVVDPSEHPILLTEAPLNPRANRERMAQIMFETFGTPAVYVAMQAVLSLYASGCSTGIVFDSGHSVSHVVPIYERRALPHAVIRSLLGGSDLIHHLRMKLTSQGYYFNSLSEQDLVHRMKESLCYVALDVDQKVPVVRDTTGINSEGFVHIGDEEFMCPEALFQPSFLGMKSAGFHEIVYDSIKKCSADLYGELCGNIVLSGGNTMFPGFKNRMQKEVSALAPPPCFVNVIAPEERTLSAWRGGAILASSPAFHQMCITMEEYNEVGPALVRVKCF